MAKSIKPLAKSRTEVSQNGSKCLLVNKYSPQTPENPQIMPLINAKNTPAR